MMHTAASTAKTLVNNVTPDQLSQPTPCEDWDVRALIHHLLTWSGYASELVARKQPVDVMALQAKELPQDLRNAVAEQLDRAIEAWAEEGATDGEATLGGPQPFPAAYLGAMLLSDLVLHGWDLAKATGQEFRVDEEIAEEVLRSSVGMAAEAREMKLFGEAVNVGDDAKAIDQALAATGRDPNWQR